MDLGYWVRAGASLVATALGAMVLLADSAGPSCETYGGYQGSYDYVNGCPSGAPAGHVTFSWAESNNEDSGAAAVRGQLSEGGFGTASPNVTYSGKCGDDEGHATPEDLMFHFGGDSDREYVCAKLHLHASGPQDVTCTRLEDAGASDPATCTITFTPSQ